MDYLDNKKSVKIVNNNNETPKISEKLYKKNYVKNKKSDEVKIGSELSSHNDILQLPSILNNQIKIIKTNESCFKDYIVLNNLGKGTYAEVWKVKHKVTNEIFAAKLLQPNQFPKESFNRIVEMFTKEIINLSICQCPGVIKLHKVIGGKEGWILIQDYANDGTLWKENLSSNMSEAFLYFIQLLQGMWYIQDMNIVHRDLKPTNILRYSNKKIVIADFGWSEHIDSCNLHPNEWPGTLEINPPEVLRNTGPMTEKIDNYALGMNMILFISGRFVCRQKGVECSKVAQIILKTVHNLRYSKPPSRFRENLKAWDLFVKLTSSNPNERLSLQNVLDHPWVTEMLNNFSLQNSKFLWHEKIKTRWIYLLSNNWNFFKNISSISNSKINKINDTKKDTNECVVKSLSTSKTTVITDIDTQKSGTDKKNASTIISENTTSSGKEKYSNSALKKDYEILYYIMKNNFKNKVNCCSVKRTDSITSKNAENKSEKKKKNTTKMDIINTTKKDENSKQNYDSSEDENDDDDTTTTHEEIKKKKKETLTNNHNAENGNENLLKKKKPEQNIKNTNSSVYIDDEIDDLSKDNDSISSTGKTATTTTTITANTNNNCVRRKKKNEEDTHANTNQGNNSITNEEQTNEEYNNILQKKKTYKYDKIVLNNETKQREYKNLFQLKSELKKGNPKISEQDENEKKITKDINNVKYNYCSSNEKINFLTNKSKIHDLKNNENINNIIKNNSGALNYNNKTSNTTSHVNKNGRSENASTNKIYSDNYPNFNDTKIPELFNTDKKNKTENETNKIKENNSNNFNCTFQKYKESKNTNFPKYFINEEVLDKINKISKINKLNNTTKVSIINKGNKFTDESNDLPSDQEILMNNTHAHKTANLDNIQKVNKLKQKKDIFTKYCLKQVDLQNQVHKEDNENDQPHVKLCTNNYNHSGKTIKYI
ncbi:serine/threonine protein kinase [Plasmodium vinckei petteri]|uniref:Serine/threonine protein kinase n=1 Tax=Plasmodium vinckei petteri TaxID=138298 RepID=W7AMJ1_PLAVN|nr:serine/threonine protein kinase [Plasmodium vinckei petteri]CAD2105205.1 serine/threonine protein kinase, putative [Plasmodium vinckei petteri]